MAVQVTSDKAPLGEIPAGLLHVCGSLKNRRAIFAYPIDRLYSACYTIGVGDEGRSLKAGRGGDEMTVWTYRAVRTIRQAQCIRRGGGYAYIPLEGGHERTVITKHRTYEAALATSQSAQVNGYTSILVSGRVEAI